jgi:uncharacterized protein (DUF697 family)
MSDRENVDAKGAGAAETALTQDSPSATALGSIVTYSVLGGLCPLIPVPFIDDIILGFIQRRAVETLCTLHGFQPTSSQTKALSRESGGCPLGCLWAVFIYPLKKILKKVLYFLSIKGCVDVASTMLHRGYLLHHCLTVGIVSKEKASDQAHLVRVQDAILAACTEVDPRPINQVLKRIFGASKVLMRGTARGMWNLFRSERKKNPKQQDEALGRAMDRAEVEQATGLSRILKDLQAEIWTQEGYLKDLVAAFEKAYEAK